MDILRDSRSPGKGDVWRHTHDRIGELLGLPERAGYCERGKRPARLQRIGNPNDQRLTKFSCGAWVCKVCSARKREEYGRHLARMVLGVANTHGLWFDQSGAGREWDAQRRKLDRRRASWVRFGVTSEPGVVIAATPMEMGRPFNDISAAVRKIGEALRKMPVVWPEHAPETRVRPINTCRGWKLPKKVRQYERIGWLTLKEPKELVERLKAIGVQTRLRRRSVINGSEVLWDVSWVASDEQTRKSIECVMSDLSCIEDKKSSPSSLNRTSDSSETVMAITGDGEPLEW